MLTNKRFQSVLLTGVVLGGCATLPMTVPSRMQVQNQADESDYEQIRRQKQEMRNGRTRPAPRPTAQPRDPQRPISRNPRHRDPIDRVVVVPTPDSPHFIRVEASEVTATGFTVNWITDQPTVGMVAWGENRLSERVDCYSPPDYTHSVKLTGLKPGTPYQYRITAVRQGGGGYAHSPTLSATTASAQ